MKIEYGNNLSVPVPAASWTLETDGFGLIQSSVTFHWDSTNVASFTQVFYRGVKNHPAESWRDYLSLHRAILTYDKAGVLVVKADYCGIDKESPFNGTKTTTQVQMAAAAASSPIESHPNFVKMNCISIQGIPLAGFPPIDGMYDPDPVTNPHNALWKPAVKASGSIANYQFVGFLPPQSEYLPDKPGVKSPINPKAGVKSYYRPQNTLRCLFYTTNVETAMTCASYCGWVTDGYEFGLPEAYKKLTKKSNGYPGNPQFTQEWDSYMNRNFLVTSCSVEIFGSVYKVTAELMLSGIAGWDIDTYPCTTPIV